MAVKWVSADWSMLEATGTIREMDIDGFIDELFKSSMRLVSVEEFYNQNSVFFETKKEMFTSVYSLKPGDKNLFILKRLLRIPKETNQNIGDFDEVFNEIINEYPRTKMFEFI